MFGCSSRNCYVLWPPALQLLNFPPHQEQEQIPRPVVHFECPPSQQLDIGALRFRRRQVAPDVDRSRVQETGDGPKPEILFVRRCYMLSGLFIITTVILAMILSKAIPPDVDLMMAGFICTMTSLMFLFILCIAARCRKFYWFSFILAGLFVELAGVGVVLVLQKRSLEHFCIALSAASIATLICYFTGAWLPKIFLPGEATMLVLLVIFVVASLCMMIMFIFTDQKIYQIAYFLFLAIVLIPTSIYHGEVVHGRRFNLPVYEFVICAVHVYLHFLLFFAAFYYVAWAPSWLSL
ncbi:uncharacterized protein LOC108098725 [Drosophila ficusphila]|uniref:uncharacterized protein LOC108098725 n=1 Tax=Drosophila ficusphila TaxID=30025 RepID=UPI0007E8412F|nr:uncharacterized protein LOC108098725 [Drosophila ficusphila]